MQLLDVFESQKLVESYGIKFAAAKKAANEKSLLKALAGLKMPLAMKVLSKKIPHKTEAGGVKLNLDSKKEILQAFRQMKKLKGFEGVLIQEMVEGIELIIGGKVDRQFGPVVLFGLGGIFVEVFRDFSLRICPLTAKDAREMIKEIKGIELLKGARGRKPVNLKKLQSYLLNASKLMTEEKIQELDLNPLIASGSSIKAVDARILV